jgi:hypothetical protein
LAAVLPQSAADCAKTEIERIGVTSSLRKITQVSFPNLSETYAAESGRVGFRIAMRI